MWHFNTSRHKVFPQPPLCSCDISTPADTKSFHHPLSAHVTFQHQQTQSISTAPSLHMWHFNTSRHKVFPQLPLCTCDISTLADTKYFHSSLSAYVTFQHQQTQSISTAPSLHMWHFNTSRHKVFPQLPLWTCDISTLADTKYFHNSLSAYVTFQHQQTQSISTTPSLNMWHFNTSRHKVFPQLPLCTCDISTPADTKYFHNSLSEHVTFQH